MEKKWSILNLLSVLLVIGVNYISQAFQLNNTTIGAQSAKYDNLFTPASYAFAIWGLIFLALLSFGIFNVYRAYSNTQDAAFIKQIGPWFALANLLNAAWVFAFMFDQIGLSLLIMLGILIALIKIVVRTNMERWDAPIEIIAFLWWPICLYSGWITVATVANISTYLTKLDWSGGFLSEAQWTIVVIVATVIINGLMLYKRNMREFAAVGVWALIAIYVRHQDGIPTIAYTALIGSIVLSAYIGYHGFQNRSSNPMNKLKERFN